MSETRRNWLIVAAYVAFIFTTLGVVRIPLAFLRAHGLLRLTLAVLFTACLSACLGWLFHSGSRQLWRYFGVLAVFATYVVTARLVIRIPEEQIHFFEYGLVGILLLRALQPERPRRFKFFAIATVLGSLVGWIDEILQGFLPSRHYDVKDIWLNVFSIILGLLVMAVMTHKSAPTEA